MSDTQELSKQQLKSKETKGRILAGLKKSRRDLHVQIEAMEKELSFWRDLKCQLQ